VAEGLRHAVHAGWTELTGTRRAIGVILSDTAGRPWRNGQTDFALGTAGIHVIEDLRGSTDANGRSLSVTERCVADEIASAADLVKGKAANIPAAHVRGLGQHVLAREIDDQAGPSIPGARELIRTGAQDWFGYGMVEAVRAALGVEPGSATASEVGIPYILSEDVATRAGRAIRIALLSCPGATAEIDGATITLTAPDDFTLGAVATRAEVALHGEGLATDLSRIPARQPPPEVAGDGLLTDGPTILIVFQ
jgi:coenzyme F420-0:L-glutamate ligase/coenzyme F420-1:gamma-L-glutamate ligase